MIDHEKIIEKLKEGLTLQEIADECGTTRERVRQILQKQIRKDRKEGTCGELK